MDKPAARNIIRVEETFPQGSALRFCAFANACEFNDGLIRGYGETAYEAVCALALNLAGKVNELRKP